MEEGVNRSLLGRHLVDVGVAHQVQHQRLQRKQLAQPRRRGDAELQGHLLVRAREHGHECLHQQRARGVSRRCEQTGCTATTCIV